MRLLRRHSTGEIRLTEHPNKKVPCYAILSHTWGTEEVTFKDLMNDTHKHKLGYDKIRFCGEQAWRDGLQYFWVDTCCIDKSNSSELQEAINRMFQWYRDATKCYVFMSDVSQKQKGNDISSQSAWEMEFRNSRWFSRGWTLQELIAPGSVDFFSKEGMRLGGKTSLAQIIQDVTGIPTNALQGCPLSTFSVSDRMSWVDKRETTIEEDKAYSLFGIFGVFIPLLYGEGEVKAFTRLQEEIKRTSKNDQENSRCLTDVQSSKQCHHSKHIQNANDDLAERSTYSIANWTIEAQNLRDIVYPLMSLKMNLSKIIPHLLDSEMILTESDVAWLMKEFQDLLMSAHSASANTNAEQIEDVQTRQSIKRMVGFQLKRKRRVEDEADYGTMLPPKKRPKYWVSYNGFNSQTDQNKSRNYETIQGNLLVRTILRKDAMDLAVKFSFIPNDKIIPEYRTGFTTVFRRSLSNIERCLTTFRMVQWEGSAFEKVANGDLVGLQRLLSERTVFPTDRLVDDGNTLIGYACREVQLDICRFLLASLEGTDPCETDSDGMNALRLLVQGFQDEELHAPEDTELKERQRALLDLVRRGCLEDESWTTQKATDGCLHLSGFAEDVAYNADEFSEMVSTLITGGAGLEIRDPSGKTPLLDDLSIPGDLGFGIIDILLKMGSDIEAVDNNGNGVFHLVLEACQSNPNDLEKKLRLLMKYALQSNLTQTNNQGYTPSDFALTPQLWPIWCKAIGEKTSSDTLLSRDRFSKIDYQERIDHPRTPKPEKTVAKLDLIGQNVYSRQESRSDIRGATADKACFCRAISMYFVRWEAQNTPGQQLPGLPRCIACGGYVLPPAMENRKKNALHRTQRSNVAPYL